MIKKSETGFVPVARFVSPAPKPHEIQPPPLLSVRGALRAAFYRARRVSFCTGTSAEFH